MAIVLVLALGVFAVTLVLYPVVAEATGHGRSFRDYGDTFQIMDRVAEYTDARLAAAARDTGLPDPPQLRGDVVTARIAYAAALVDQAVFIGLAIALSGRGPAGFARDLGLDRSPGPHLSRPIIAAALTVAGLVLYGLLVRWAGLDWLAGNDLAPRTVLRDTGAFVLFAVSTVAVAPIAEELIFRGMVFRGLLRLGFVPAAIVSALIFAAWHGSPLVPIFAAGMVLAWLYYVSATLWEPLVFHAIFNLVSVVQFASMR